MSFSLVLVTCSPPAAIPTQRATACVHEQLPPVAFLLTSTPDRAPRLPRVLAMLRKQTLVPHTVVLTIAANYDAARFANATFDAAALQRVAHHNDNGAPVEHASGRQAVTFEMVPRSARLVVHTLPLDRGPISKYLGATGPMLRTRPDAIVVVGDDDMDYGSTFIEDYACAVSGGPAHTVYSSGIDVDCRRLGGCVMGFRGVAMRADMLQALPTMSHPSACFLADDVAITHYLTHVPHHFTVRRLRLRSKYAFDDAFAWSNSSINAYHRERKFKVNKACVAALVGVGGAVRQRES